MRVLVSSAKYRRYATASVHLFLLIYQVMGRTRQNRPVFLDGDITQLRGKLIKTKITECRPWSLTGVAQGEPY